MLSGTHPNTGMNGFFGSITSRRKLPDRGTAQSRSLDYPNGGGPAMETVLEAGRGVRKLPPQPVGTSTLNRGGGLWQNGGSTAMMNGNLSMPHQGPPAQQPQPPQGPNMAPGPMVANGPLPMDMGGPPGMMGPPMGPQVGPPPPPMGPMGSMGPMDPTQTQPMANGMMNPAMGNSAMVGNGYLPGQETHNHMQMMPQQPEWT